MKKIITALALTASIVGTAQASPLTYDFIYAGKDWGTMTIDVFDVDSLSVRYNAALSSVIPAGSQATGFGFSVNPTTTTPTSVTNPTNGAFSGDQDGLNWTKLANLNAIPNPANSSLTKDDFYFGATEGNANNITPPGILPGQWDIFYLNFSGVDFTDANFKLTDFIENVGVRLQSLPENINGGSLYLVGTPPVPEPGTIVLLGAGFLGLAAYGRKRIKK